MVMMRMHIVLLIDKVEIHNADIAYLLHVYQSICGQISNDFILNLVITYFLPSGGQLVDNYALEKSAILVLLHA